MGETCYEASQSEKIEIREVSLFHNKLTLLVMWCFVTTNLILIISVYLILDSFLSFHITGTLSRVLGQMSRHLRYGGRIQQRSLEQSGEL